MTNRDRELEQSLERSLTPRDARAPAEDRVAAVRLHAQANAATRSPTDDLELRRSTGPASRRDVLIGGIAASVGAVLGISGAVVATRSDGGPEGPPTEAIEFAAADERIRTTAALINHTWGTELMLDVEGLPGDNTYQVVYASTNDGPVVGGSFRSVEDTLLRCRFNAAVLRADVARIAVAGPDGREILSAKLI